MLPDVPTLNPPGMIAKMKIQSLKLKTMLWTAKLKNRIKPN